MRPIYDAVDLRVSAASPSADLVALRGAPTTWLRLRFASMGAPTPDRASGPIRLIDRKDHRLVYALDTPLALDSRPPESCQSRPAPRLK